MARSWGGLISCAVHVPDLADKDRVMAELVDLHARVEAMGQCRLYLTLVTEDLTGFPAAIKDMYPINALRNGQYALKL